MAVELKDTEKSGSKTSKPSRKGVMIAIALLVIVVLRFIGTNWSTWSTLIVGEDLSYEEELCPIYDKIAPSFYYTDNSTVEHIMKNEEFKKKSIEKLSNAVKIDTCVYDNSPEVSADPKYWAKFDKFHEYLESTFASVYKSLKVETVNTYGLIFTWEGSDSSLKPILLTLHQDTVPVQEETIADWTYDPWSGYYDGNLIHGRGVGDCKSLLVGLLETVELLLSEDFKPKRTIILAFGADEEISGQIFATKIGELLEDRYGPDSIYAILDEGAGALEKVEDIYVAAPATAEKGATNILFELFTPGGHSSVPPDHTSIGIMSEVVTLLESNPFPPVLTTANPALGFVQCVAKYSERIDPTARKNILRAGFDKIANSKAIEIFNANKYLKFLIRTSQAIDIIEGGAKSNALPEHVAVTMNHRVGFESSTQETYDRDVSYIKQVAEKYGLGLILDDGTEMIAPTAKGYFQIKFEEKTEPTKVSPTTSDVWSVYSGALRHLYEDIIFEGSLEKPVVVAPNVPTGNTDTRHYLNLSDHVYRSIPGWSELSMLDSHVHSVNEQIEFSFHLHGIAFYYEYLHMVLDELC